MIHRMNPTDISNSSPAYRLRFDSPEQEVFLNLWRTYDRLRSLEEEMFRPFGLTPQQYNVLRLLEAEGADPLPTLALADRLVSRAPDITRIIDKLEQSGWVRRERPAENRRQVLISLTPTGEQLLKQIDIPLRACHNRQLGHLSADEMTELICLLRKARQPHETHGSTWHC